jgi:hypothetical protein
VVKACILFLISWTSNYFTTQYQLLIMVPNEILVCSGSYDAMLLEVALAYFKSDTHLKGMMKTVKNFHQDTNVDLDCYAMCTCSDLPTYQHLHCCKNLKF